jgi:hypothetical protein
MRYHCATRARWNPKGLIHIIKTNFSIPRTLLRSRLLHADLASAKSRSQTTINSYHLNNMLGNKTASINAVALISELNHAA